MTATANTAFTAAQFNTHVRDNLNETAVAKATAAGRYYVSTGANALAERIPSHNFVTTSETTVSTTYVALATAQSVTLTTGTLAWVFLTAQCEVNAADQQIFATVVVSGASSVAASDENSLVVTNATTSDPLRATALVILTGLTAGSNTFTMQFRTSSGTASIRRRSIAVLGW